MKYQWNRELCYRSGKQEGIPAAENRSVISEEIGKDATTGASHTPFVL
jgi:hypothetical protein